MKNSFYKTLYNYNIKNYFNNNFWGFFLNYCIIKFKFDYNKNKLINNVFDKAKYLLNFQFDNNSNVFFIDTDVDYQIKDVSNLNSKNIESITNSFFNYEFEDTLNVFLYKFLVLKNNDKFTLLAMIHPLIFNYSSINDFYELFYNVNNVRDENYLTPYYEDVKNYLNSSDYDNDSDYWRDIRLNAGNYVKFHNLKSDNYNHYKIKIDKEPVLNFINSHDCSLFNFYACAFSLYMSRINRQEGCLLKTNIPSRGASLKTILKFDLNSDCSFADYLHQFTSIYDEAVSHTKVSIENYMGEDLSYYSIYDFSDLNENISIYNGDDSALTLNIYDGCLEIVYNADLFSDIYIQHMADNIKSLINNVIEFPDYILKDVNILSDNEKKLLSDFCKGEDADVDEDLLIARYFRQHALENPDAIAVDDGVNQVSYRELEKSSNSIANDLFENYDVSLDSHVALMLPRNYHFPELVLALNKLGAAFIPIDTIYPVNRIEHMLEISEAECIVTTKDIAGKLDLDFDMICIEDLNSDDYDVDVEIVATGENLFSIMFTSGTTGLPKGVKVTNHQLAGLFESFKNIFSFSYGDLIGCYLSFSFIASYVIFLAFAFGGGCRIFNENEQKDILSLIRILKEKPMNSLFLPPTLAIPVLESEDIKLDYLVLAGGKLKELSKRERSTQLINFYGTTEIVFGVTKVYDFKDIEDNNLPIGRPVTNTNVYILDEHANQMPIGVPGEICVSSEYISPGYYNNPELTSEVFVDNPYSDSENNKIMYRTGDIGFYNFDGDIEIIGREDDQLSVRGFRIESSEILNIVNGIPEIENVYLDAENDTLALYYTTNAEIDIDLIKKELMDELPNYMVPSLFMELEEIPLNMNGKMDRARLKKMSKVNAEIGIEDEVLSGVVDAFKEVLDTDLVLIDDNFVELGGNSLFAMNLQILLREKFYVTLSSQEIIELSTPNNISDYIKSNFKGIRGIEEIKYAFDDGCPLSESQLNVYLDEITQDMGTKYNNPFIIEFKKKYSVDQIRNALNKLFEVHPILKGRIMIKKDEMPSCIFDAKPEIQEGSLNNISSFVRPFDLEKYLSRFLIMVDENSTSLCMDIHHVIFDGSSINILLNTLYSILDDKNVDFVDDGILRQITFEENLSPDYMDEAKTFMSNMLADREESHELMPSIGGDVESNYINTFNIDGNELTDFLQNHSITRNQFFSSVFAYTLSRFTGSSKVLFNILEDGRGHIDHTQSIGMFVKTLPIIMDCKNQTVDSFLEYSRGLVNTVMKYDLYPFRLLANEFDLKFDISFQYAHNLFSALMDKDEYGYCVNELEHDPEGDLSFFIFDVGEDKLGIRILYSDKFSNTFIETFTKTYMLILHEMLNVGKLEEINYIGNDDLNILDSFNQTEHDLKYDCVLDAFNRQLAENPDNILTLSDDANYTYSQIAYIVNSLNSLLKQHEVRANDIVAVFVDRSHWTLITALSCLSQGITYVPIDENHPNKTIEFMIRQSESKAMIVTDTFHKRVEKINDESKLNLNIINVSSLLNEIKTSNHVDYVDSSVNDVACILYTSGTTGNPKAVQMTTLGILNLIEYYVASTKFCSDDVQGIFASVGFDVSLEQFASVFTGGSLTYVPTDIKLNIYKLNDYFIKYGVTHTLITTQMAKLFVNTVSETSLKYLQTAGEKLGSITPPKNYILSDVYGPTEANYISSIEVQNKIDDSSVGILNWNTKAYILDKELRRVPLGAVGEIYLSGYQTTKGYFNNPKENENALFQNPFDGKIKGYNEMYKTRDLGRYLQDGSIAIIGRADSQVKIRGNRVELSEIEQTIRRIDEIDDVTVKTVKNGQNNELVAYVVAPNFKGNIIEYVKDYMKQCKPEYMVPSFVVSINEIPLNVNGKVDKHLLPEVDVDTLRSEYIAPRNKLEKDITNAFEEVFNCEEIGIYDDFIQLGGDSLTAIKLLAILGDYNLSAGDILSLRTPQAIADNINKNNVEFDLDVYSIDSGCPLNEAQLNIYLDIIVNEKTDAYLLPIYMEFSNDYELNEITGALNKMFEIHPILKMCISDEYDVPYMVRNSKPKITVESDVGNDFILEFLTQSFDLHENLCRFLVIENNNSYALYGAFHHIICDAKSCAIFKENLLAILNRQTLEIDDSFLKVSAFAQKIQESELFLKAHDFYENMLVECTEAGILSDNIGADESGTAQIDLDLDGSIFLNSSNINENVLFTSVFAYTLSRFTGNDKALFDIIDNGRSRFNNYNAIGMYVNTLPLLVDCSNRDISSFIEYVTSLVYEVQSYNYYPFRLLANEYDIDANILFQFVPEWVDNDDNNVREVYEKLGILRNMNDLNADLTFEVLKKDSTYYLNVIYCDKYSSDFINQFIQSYKLILHGILNANKLSDINYISNEDIKLLDDYNNTEYNLVYDDVLDAFNDNLAQYPDSPLVSMDNNIYSHAECAFIAFKIAELLKQAEVNVDDCVSFVCGRSEWYLLSVLSVLSIGAVPVPIDNNLPDERIEFMIKDSNSKVIITDNENYSHLRDLSDDSVFVNVSSIVEDGIGTLSYLPVVYGNLAGILYTSGTTGIPKGVKITRKSVLNLAAHYADAQNLTNEDVYALYPSIGFDAGYKSIFKVLYSGAQLVIIPEDIKYDMDKFNDYLIGNNVGHVFITTQVSKLFMQNVNNTSLKVLSVGGEKLGKFESPENYIVMDDYGPTEAFAFITSIDISQKTDDTSIGILNYNSKAYILDHEGRRVPCGAVGELYLAGHQIADGYLNREEETVKSFVDNPFDGGIMYRTGDMVRMLPDNTLAIEGRRDSQVKIRGNRVELSEIETVIREIDYVEDVTVQAIKNGDNNELVAYVVASGETYNLKDNICNYVGEYKPDYMIPSFVVPLDEIPLTINGKVDKRALPEVNLTSLRAEYVAPRNKVEKDIVDAFEKVFNRDKISIYDDFTHLGGDSLKAIKLLSEMDDYNVSVADILSLHTPYAIAKNINKSDMQFDLDIYSVDSGCPLSESQLNVYLDMMANDKKDSYLIPLSMNISDEYDINDIKNALNVMLEVHPILGMCVSDDFDVPYLVKGSKPSITVESNVSDEFINNLVEPFDLHDSLCRFLIVENDDGFSLFAVFHHIIFDALSDSIFKQDLQSILDNNTVDLDDSFLKVSAFSQQIVETSTFVEADEFYESMLVDVDEAGELLDSVLSDGPGSVLIDLDLDRDLINSFLDKHNASVNLLFSGAFAYTLSRFVGSEKVLFNIVENGRDRFANYNSIGMFVNTLPLLIDCKNQNIDSFMDYMFDRVYGVMRYNYYPFRLLANKYDINSNILFQFIPEWIKDTHNFDDVYDNELLSNMDDLIADLTVEIIQRDNNYILSVLYSDKYSRDFINHFVESYKLILKGMVNVSKLSDISYISSRDLVLLDEINGTGHDLIYDDVLDAFNDNLSKCPDNKLVLFGDDCYSYGEGAFIASRIAESLIDLDVRHQDCVGFLVPRSDLYMFSVLGVLSAGGVYVPLDDDLPDERIEFILRDSDCKVVIVNDDTEERLSNLNCNCSILNISDIINGDIGSMSCLPAVYGDLACILYTSGTTGVPKGVKITRKSIVNVVESYIDKYGLTSNDVYGLFSAIGFDVSNFVICAVLYSGCCLSVIPKDIRLNMVEMNNYFIKHDVSHAFITTQVGKLFMQNVDDISLDVLLVAGEKLGDVENPSDYKLVDGFGPTEAFAFISTIPNSQKINQSSVGYLNYNIKAYVLDNECRRVPYGAVGELYLSGYQVADGYLNREEETENAFIKNPFENNPDYDVLYRTGDMVRLLPDASLGIVGRRDSQVKIRGNRVELGEVEAVIHQLDYILDVTVQTVKIKDNYELVAYVVSDESDDDSIRNSIQEHVGKVKPDYMVPSFVICLDHIPLTVNGKVDRRALPEVDISSLSVEYVAPTNETEEQIVSTFEVVFNQKGIGLNDDFTRLGGDSIMAIRLISLLEKDGISCSARDILNYKTPYLIAQNVEKISKKSYDATTGEVDLLPIQSYFFDQINSNEFIQEFILKCKSNLDLDTLQSAFDELSDVHDMLRATYKYDNNNVIQEILPLNIRVCEIKEYMADDLNKTVKNIINESKKSLDVSSDLIKISLIHYDNESYVVFVIHHLIIDGISWSILIDDLTYIINKLKNNEEIDLLRPYPYKNWVNDIKSLVEDISGNEKQQWTTINNQLDDSLIKGESKGFKLNIDAKFDVDNLLMMSEEEYLALSIARAYKKTYTQNIIFNRETHGRDEILADVSRTVGWFTSQFPVLVDTNNNYDSISLIRDVYSIKKAFKDINHLGLNYESLIYTTNELKHKHCPVTFNFLSSEFSFENELFKSIYPELANDGELELVNLNHISFGISLNVSRMDTHYAINGEYADGTYLGDKFTEFIENIKHELEYIGNYDSEVISCCLSESQLGIYLDEKVNEMGTAYSTAGIFECPKDKSVDEIKNAIHRLIEKHPVLMGRVVDGDVPLLVCDSYPSIKIIKSDDYLGLIKPFDLNKTLSRFYIMENNNGKFVFYDMHHIISDATSRTIINEDLSLNLSDVSDDSKDLGFVYASRDSFNSQFESIYDEAYEFYKNNLSDIDETTTLIEDIEGVDNTIRLPIHDVREDVETFCREHGITVSNFFNAVFAYTYSRFTGMNKVYYNFTENGRHEEYAQSALGMFVRTIPIIVNCEKTSVSEYLSGVSDLILDAMKYSVYPFRLLAKEFDLNNDVAFEYNLDLNTISGVIDDLTVEDTRIDLVSDFLCVVNDLDDGYLVSVESCSKYSNDTIIRFLNAFNEILRGLLNCSILSDINYHSSDDLVLLDEINNTEHDLIYSDVLDAFEDNLSKYPDNPLVLGDGFSYTYVEAAFLIDKIQKLLNDNNIGVNDTVSVFVERNHWVLLSNLAVLSVGASYVPIDENHPINRMKYMVENSNSKAIITTNHFQNMVDELIGELDSTPAVINVSSLSEDVGELNSLTYHNPTDNDVACILFTSGTTGNPKAVQVGRHSIANMASYYQHNSNFTSDDVYGVFASVGFDISLQHYVALLTGGSVIWIPNDIKLNIRKLNEYFIKYGVTHTIITTQVSKLFIQSIDYTSIKNLCAVGEKLGAVTPPENYAFIDVYGPTEATSSMTSINVADKIDDSSVGGPDWNTKIYVLDSHQKRVPFGAVGELYISGYQVSKGYLNNPEANRKAFFTNPFDGKIQGYETMYKTGDIVRLLPDGTVGFIGRNDSQVKIRGNRVELSEIESAIRKIDYITDITVQTIKHDANNEIVAYVVVNNDLDEIELKYSICDYVSKHKPEYMVPSYVIKLDAIPLNVNGKVDKRALPDVDKAGLHAEYVAPRDENEKEIVKAFEKALNLDKIGIYDDFVRLGGDSLTAIKLLNYIESDDVAMADIFTFRTPEAIAKNMSEFSFDLDIYSLEEGCPLNSAQINVFADVNIYNKKNAYHVPGYIPISKKYGLEKIMDSLDEILDMHPVLSTHLIEMYETNDADVSNSDLLKDLIKTAEKFGIKKIMDIVKKYGIRNVKGIYKMLKTTIKLFKGEYPYLVMGEKPPISVQSKLDKAIIIDFFAESFDLYNYLSKFMIVESEESYYLFYMVHHIIFDAMSAGVFKRQLITLLDGGSIDFDDTFLKSSAFTHQIKNTEKFDEAAEFYQTILSDLDDVDILLEDNPSAEGYKISSYDLKFDKTTFKSFLRNTGISENVLFTSVFSYALSQFVNGNKVIFTMIENGRDRFDENFIGMTSNVMPVVIDCNNQSINSYIDDVADTVYGVLRHSYYPILLLYQKYDFEVNILFQFVPNWIADEFTEDVDSIEDIDSEEIMNYVLNNFSDYLTEFFVQVYQNGDDYTLFITHSKKYSDELVEDFKNMYITILSNIINSDISSDLSNTL